MKRPTYIIIFIFVTIMGLAIAQISMANQISTTGAELGALQQQVDDYKRQNTILQEQFLEASSLTSISGSAERLGFVAARNQVSLAAPLPLALKQ